MVMQRFFYHYPGAAIAYDIWALDLKDARKRLREHLGVKRLAKFTMVWRA
jgi:hypothetical protein